jgi:hypothetical protein
MATGTSLKNTLFYQRKFGPTMSLSTSSSSHRESLSAFESTGLAECVVVLSGKMTPESCRSLCNTTGPSDIRLEAEIVDLLPSNAVVPDELSKFCFPEGIFLHDELLPPRTFDMVLTDIKGQRLFASCLHFYEEKDPIEVLALISNVQKGKSLSLPPWISLKDIQQRKSKWKCFVPKSLCVISIYPLYQTFREFLAQLYRLSISTPGASNPSPASSPTHAGSVSSASAAITVSAPLPIESYIFNFLNQVPMPKTSQTQTCFSIADRVYLLRGNSSSSSFYPTEVDFSLLFQCLSIENILKVYTYILTEKKVGLCAENNSILTPVAETLRALLCPFECQMVYIPVLPLALFEFMSAPVPFLMGIQTDKTEVEVLTREGVIVVDLDKNEVHVPRQEPLPTLPEHKVKKFIPTLKKVCSWASSQRTKDSYGSFRTGELCEVTFFEGTAQPSEVDLQLLTRHNDEIMEKWTEIQTLFTSFAHAVILKDYRKFCHKRISTSDGTETIIFDRKGYISMHPSLREFGPHFFQTQMFQRFLEYGPSGGINENLAAHPLMLSDSESFIGRTIRYKSTIRKDSIDEPGRNNFRRTITAPLPMKGSGAFRSPSLQSSVQRYGLQQFQPFNAEVYEEFHAQPSNLVSSGEIHSSLLASTNFLIPSANSLMADEDSTPPVQTQPMRLSRVLGSPSSTSSSPNTSNRDSEASQLISAARMRLEIATKETETISSNKSPEKDQRSSQQLNVLVPY